MLASLRFPPTTNDPVRPKPVLYIWARSWDPPHDVQANVSFNQVLRRVSFDIRGQAGAIAVDLQGAQGTAVQDVSIEAAGAFAGLRGLTGSGGSTHGLTVRGGQYGVFAAAIGDMRLTGSQPPGGGCRARAPPDQAGHGGSVRVALARGWAGCGADRRGIPDFIDGGLCARRERPN